MRVGFVVGAFPEVSTTFILDQITGLLDLGHDVQVFARAPIGRAPVHGDYEHYGLAARTHHWWSSSRAAGDVLRGTLGLMRANLRHHGRAFLRAFDVRRYGSQAAIGRYWSYRTVMLAHGSLDVVLAQFGPNGRIALALRDLGAFDAPIATTFLGYDLSRILREEKSDYYADLFARSELMLPLSHHFRERLLRLGCPESKIRIHPVGVDLGRFHFKPREPRTNEPVRLITVARLVEKKGLEYGLRALAKLKGRGVRFHYAVVGEGPLRSRLEHVRSELGLEAEVRFHGSKKREQVAPLLDDADLFLSPSATAQDGDEEGVPAAIKEAMAAGLPVISTFHAAIPEVITDGVSGFLVPEHDVDRLAQCLEEAIARPEIWPRIARAAREVVEREYDLTTLNRTLAEHLTAAASDYRRVQSSEPLAQSRA